MDDGHKLYNHGWCMDYICLFDNRSYLMADELKTGVQWAGLYGIMIIDRDGFGERMPDRPLSTEVMTEEMFQKCIVESTTHIFDRKEWSSMVKKYEEKK